MSAPTPTPAPGWYDPIKMIDAPILAKLDPEFVAIWTKHMNEHPPPDRNDMTIEAIRANPFKLAPPSALDNTGYPRTADREVVSDDGETIPVRVYTPDEAQWGKGPYPLHMNFHGGGFVLGGLFIESTLCQSMCDGAGVVVVDVNYRHCPETIWGKCFQDALAALKWALAEATTPSLNIKKDSVSVGGISAGAHITLVLQRLARDAGIALKLAMPSVPATTACLSYKDPSDSPYASFREFANGPVLPWASIKFFGNYTMPEDQREALRAMWPDWWFAPVGSAVENLKGLCPTFVRTGECDPLCDEGEAYALKLAQAGNKVTIKRYLGSAHTFMAWPTLGKKKEYDADSIQALREAHGTGWKSSEALAT